MAGTEPHPVPCLQLPLFKNASHHSKSFEILNTMRQQQLLCDVTVCVGNKNIQAHRATLASASPYFYAMFTGEMSESKQNIVNIKEVDADALELLIEYCYTAEVKVTEENVQALLPAASLLQLTDVRNACCEFLKTQLHPTNCLGIMRFADMHMCQDLVVAAHSYIEQYFTDVVASEEFLQLEARQVIDFIASDQLTVPSEEKVYEAVRAWVYYNRQNRDHYFPELMQHVRLPLLSRDYLVDRVETESLMKQCSACKDYLIEAMKYHLLPRSQRLLLQTPRTKSRTPGRPKILYVVGGQAPKAIRSVECYDIQSERWYNAADMNLRRCRAGVSVSKGIIYAVGGFNGALRVRSVDSYDPKKDEWRPVASMEARRSTLGAAVLNGLLYSVGGFDGTTGLNTCEVYEPRHNEWQPICNMSVRRSSVGVGVLKGHLYAVGGYDGASRQCLSSVERYDPVKNEWQIVTDMTVKRSGAGVGVLGDYLYAVGGHDGPHVRKSVEYYNPDSNKWTLVADMSLARRNAGVAAVDGLLYVVGGDDGSINLSTVEIYSPRTDQWTLLPSQMSTGRSYAGVVVVEKPFSV
ncbi:kelch-like protein 2 [Hydractinia symbiolongicarpus]|uniref:kelch-like protein 2 n=1 Tax=Hydractinia symbiolongicarpus TaxID=13093 RepID=UPI00254CF7CC|nr:kelch-like protein 2 [Hydractinia symbiolongicarpus]